MHWAHEPHYGGCGQTQEHEEKQEKQGEKDGKNFSTLLLSMRSKRETFGTLCFVPL
jgi:hypothetical protein